MTSKSSSAADILTSAFLNRNVTRLLSAVCSTIRCAPVPSIPPLAFTGPAIFVIGCVKIDLSFTVCSFTFLINWNVQPVSSYGRGFCGG
ncbi:hypothetical protein D3C83_92030 [compost metagenome]